MLQKIKIKSLEDIALKLIKRDNEASKHFYSYHDTVKMMEFEIKTNNTNNKEEIKMSTSSRKDDKQINEELTKSLKTLNSTNANQKILSSRNSKSKTIQNNINNSKNKINNSLNFKYTKLVYDKILFFPLDYNNIMIIINECYYPLLQYFQSFDNFGELIFEIEQKIEMYFNNDSFFALSEKSGPELEEFIEEEKILELIEFCLNIFMLQNFVKMDNFSNNYNQEDIYIIYQESYMVLQKLYENLILKLLYNENYNKLNNKEKNNETIDKFINDFFIFIQKPKNNEQIIDKINDNMLSIYKGLYNSINIIINLIYKNEDSSQEGPQIYNFENGFEELLNDPLQGLNNDNDVNSMINLFNFYTGPNSELFQKFLEKYIKEQNRCMNIIFFYFNLMINKNKIKHKNTTKIVKQPFVEPQSLYKNIQISIYVYYDNFKLLLEKSKTKEPFLPPIDNNKYTYTLVLDLDETLVHYIEENDKNYVQVRPFAEYFISEMGKYFELVIFTSAEEEYANIILNEIDKNNVISHKLYRRNVEFKDGFCLKDLNKLGRDIKKVCIIDNDKNNFKLHEDNGIEIKEYMGEQEDNELDLLGDLLMTIVQSNLDDIRPIIKDLRNKINKIEDEKNSGINNEI